MNEILFTIGASSITGLDLFIMMMIILGTILFVFPINMQNGSKKIHELDMDIIRNSLNFPKDPPKIVIIILPVSVGKKDVPEEGDTPKIIDL